VLFSLVPRKIIVIKIITKTLELVFNHFFLNYFLDLERSSKRGGIGVSRVRNKGGFFVLGGDNLFHFIGMFSNFQPCLGAIHEDLGMYFIL
jgi:hypothetical protein